MHAINNSLNKYVLETMSWNYNGINREWLNNIILIKLIRFKDYIVILNPKTCKYLNNRIA